MNLTFLKKRLLDVILVLLGITLASCSGETPQATVPLMPSASETATATRIWFPPTNTPTLFPTQAPVPTEDFRQGVGTVIFSDSFDDPVLWNTSVSDQGSATLIRNRLVLSITSPGPLSLVSLRDEPVMGNFYTEAMVDISLCNGKDGFGMIWRAAAGGNYYRYTVNCANQERVERVKGGVSYPLIEWISSGDAPSGAPAQLKVGVWTVGREMRLFLNDHYQFSLQDPVFSSGTIGFFIYANGQTPVTISFLNLSAYSVLYSSPTPTPIATRTPTPSQAATP